VVVVVKKGRAQMWGQKISFTATTINTPFSGQY
jgi:hypothetical protein